MKTRLQFRRSSLEDLPRLLEIFKDVTALMIENGIHQWDGSYPNAAVVINDIRKGTSWVATVNERIIGTYCLDDLQDEQYRDITWSFKSDKVAVIHRVAIEPDSQAMGLGKALCTHSEEMASFLGFEVIRLDAYSGNDISNNMYLKLGYSRAAGLCYFHNNDIPFYCYEKALSL
jgi:ribosomal protein S18 acetylase RimI-like enzyme